MGRGEKDLSKCWNLANCFRSKNRKVREIDEYQIDDPIAKYDPKLVQEALTKVRCYSVKRIRKKHNKISLI